MRICSSPRFLHFKALFNLEVLTPLVLHGQSILRCYVGPLTITYAELQLLEQDGQEEEDLPPANGLTNALPLPQAKRHHFLTLCPVYFSPFSIEETLWVEGRWIFPKLLIVIDLPLVDKHTQILRDEVAIQYCVFRCAVRNGEGQEGGMSEHL